MTCAVTAMRRSFMTFMTKTDFSISKYPAVKAGYFFVGNLKLTDICLIYYRCLSAREKWIAGLIVILYVVFAEWRIAKMKKRWISCVSSLAKMQKDKTLWYSGVLPQADALCLFEDADGKYLISTLNGTPSADFSKIKRWIYLKDLENL